MKIIPLEFLSYSPVKFVFFLKSRLLLNVLYCFCLFVNKHFANPKCAYLKKMKDVIMRNLHDPILYKDECIARFLYLHGCTFNRLFLYYLILLLGIYIVTLCCKEACI